jgi:hypothetical protein
VIRQRFPGAGNGSGELFWIIPAIQAHWSRLNDRIGRRQEIAGKEWNAILGQFKRYTISERRKGMCKEDLIADIVEVEEALEIVTKILEYSSHDSLSAHWTIRSIARDKLRGLATEVAEIKEHLESIDFWKEEGHGKASDRKEPSSS